MATKNLTSDLFFLSSNDVFMEQESKLLEVKKAVLSMFEMSFAEVPEVVDIKVVYEKLIVALDEPELFNRFSRREEKLIPWALLQQIGDEPLFERPGAISVVFNWLLKKNSYQSIPGFIHAFLSEYPITSKSFASLKNAIEALIEKSDSPKVASLKEWSLNVDLFSQTVMSDFVQIAIEKSLSECVSKYRLYRGLQFGSFFKVGLASLLTELSGSLSAFKSIEQEKITEDLISTFIDSNEDFVYPALRNDFVEGLLLSYQSAPPKKRLKDRIKKVILKHYGDPRISKARWVGVSEEAVSVMRAWMVENTMHDFFNLLSHVAKTDSTADNHWQYRKRFWNAYLKKGVIQEAWVALGPRANQEASAFLSKSSSFATLTGGAQNHSSLIMVIGGVLITEWSHSGKYRLWERNLSGPTLYKRAYKRSELVSDSDYEGAHHSSDSGGWQYKLSTLIKDLTGISVSSREYMNDR